MWVHKKYLSHYGLGTRPIDGEIDEFLGLGSASEDPSEFDSRLFCPLCLIKKPAKTRHVKKVNLCIKDFQFYSKFFDKIVFGSNHKWYLFLLATQLALLLLFLCITLFSFSFRTDQPFWMFFVDFLDLDLNVFSKFFFVLNLVLLPSFVIDLLIQLICITSNLTYDEIVRPQHYPYLFTNINDSALYQNPNHKGVLANIKAFFNN